MNSNSAESEEFKDYRKGICALFLNQQGELIVFNRIDWKNSWQSVEGGVDMGESYEDALYREVYEEVGLKKNKYAVINETKKPIYYDMPKRDYKSPFKTWNFKGQAKKAYLLKLLDNKPTFKYDITEEIEFSQHKTTTAKQLINECPEFKKEFYTKILKEFGFDVGEKK